jgi:hypothetical protein
VGYFAIDKRSRLVNQNQPSYQSTENQKAVLPLQKSKQDLVVLKYMAQQMRVTLQAPGQMEDASLPWSYYLNERQRRTHRILLYQPQSLLQKHDLAFVGFVSGRQQNADPEIVDRLNATDYDMLSELTHVPGLLSYSSLELRAGRWYNLVVLKSLEIKSHFHTIGAHRHAAYELSPHYYEWIRLHSGSLPGGLAGGKMALCGTKYYTFPGNGQRPHVQEHVYSSCCI